MSSTTAAALFVSSARYLLVVVGTEIVAIEFGAGTTAVFATILFKIKVKIGNTYKICFSLCLKYKLT